jgi:hypothetical protein
VTATTRKWIRYGRKPGRFAQRGRHSPARTKGLTVSSPLSRPYVTVNRGIAVSFDHVSPSMELRCVACLVDVLFLEACYYRNAEQERYLLADCEK